MRNAPCVPLPAAPLVTAPPAARPGGRSPSGVRRRRELVIKDYTPALPGETFRRYPSRSPALLRVRRMMLVIARGMYHALQVACCWALAFGVEWALTT